MESTKKKMLPLGSIVTLKGLKRKMVVMGYMMKEDNDSRFYDYIGCVYPIGAISNDAVLLFDRNLIETVIFEGFSDENGDKFREDIYDAIGVDKK